LDRLQPGPSFLVVVDKVVVVIVVVVVLGKVVVVIVVVLACVFSVVFEVVFLFCPATKWHNMLIDNNKSEILKVMFIIFFSYLNKK
jgi:hypothetical protein